MKVVEKFISINGEGLRAGELAVFVRFRGCNLRCSYCDTMWANEANCPYVEESPEEIYAYIKESGIKNVTLTGGEPLLQKDIASLICLLLSDSDLRVEIETNGAVSLKKVLDEIEEKSAPDTVREEKSVLHIVTKEKPASDTVIPERKSEEVTECQTSDTIATTNTRRPVFTMDYKLPSSLCEHKMLLDNFSHLSSQDTVKFVCGSENDLIRAKEIIEQYDLISTCHVYFSPVFGSIEPEDMVHFLIENRLNDVRLQIQIHKVIWDPERRGV